MFYSQKNNQNAHIVYASFALITFLSLVLLAHTGQAQNVQINLQEEGVVVGSPAAAPVATASSSAPKPKSLPPAEDSKVATGVEGFNPNKYASLVFTYWEQAAIQDARRSRGLVRAPTEAELMRDLKKTDRDPKQKPPPEERDIALGGIVYHGVGDWTIWLNNKRVTPDALPEEIIDLRVFSEYIEMKWFDEYTDQIFPIRLRPHQRFNIDVRMFLPG